MKDLKRDERRKISFSINFVGEISVSSNLLAKDVLYVKTAKQSLRKLHLIFKLKNTFAKMYPNNIINLSIKTETVNTNEKQFKYKPGTNIMAFASPRYNEVANKSVMLYSLIDSDGSWEMWMAKDTNGKMIEVYLPVI